MAEGCPRQFPFLEPRQQLGRSQTSFWYGEFSMSHGFLRLILLGALAVCFPEWAKGQEITQKNKEFREGDPLLRREIIAPAGYVYQAVFSSDGTKIAAGSGGSIKVWNVADGKLLVGMQLPSNQMHLGLIFSRDGKTLHWCGREDPMVRIFDLKTGRQLREFPQPGYSREEHEQGIAEGHKRKAFSSPFLNFSSDGTRIAFYGRDKGVDIVEVATGKIVQYIDDPDWVRGCVFANDGKRIACYCFQKGVRVYETKTGKLMTVLKKGALSGTDYAIFSPDGNYLAAWGHNPYSLDVWDVQTGKRVCTIAANIYFVSAVFSQDNQSILLVTAWGETILHNIIAEKTVLRFGTTERRAHYARFSPDQKQVAILGQAKGAHRGYKHSIFLYDLPALVLDPAEARIDDAELAKLWEDLTSDNDFRLELLQKAFRAAPKQAVAVFRKKIPPITMERQQQAEAWIAELDDADYTKRDRAMKDLLGIAHLFTPLLKARHKGAQAGEMRNRLAFVLWQTSKEKTPLPLVHELRVLALLEEMATPDARELLSQLAQGAPQARLTVEAQTALIRLTKKSLPPQP